jgi:mono/diheme cytochrome c family protein
MKTLLKVVLGLVLVLVLLAAGGYAWASSATAQVFERSIDVPPHDFPVPYPAAPADDAGYADAAATAEEDENVDVHPMAAAIERGEHLVRARYGCADCHGENLGGGVMMDAMPMGRFLGPNLTGGPGSAVEGFTPVDWDRAVRHGVGTDGRPLVMPAMDFQSMSDRELSDIVAFITALPAIDNEVEAVALGPIGKMLIARGTWEFSADLIDPQSTHPAEPPAAGPTAEFGAHLAATCVGCHKADYSGGPIGGDPSWAPAANLTAAGNVSEWTLDEFVRAMRDGVRPDGTELLEPMTYVLPGAQRMTDVELEAIYRFLLTLPARETVEG